jgi:hypothetical protein
MNAELAKKAGHVNLDRALGELQSAGYLLIGSALHDQPQNVELPTR